MPTRATAKSNDERGPRRSPARASAPVASSHSPFSWQDGRRLWILEGDATQWVLAELRFEPQTCRYVEVRRSAYRWPREAAGALLGRAIGGGKDRAEKAAQELAEWAQRSQRLH